MLNLNFADKIFAGVNQSYTFLSDEGSPSGKISVEGTEVEYRIIPLGPPKDEPTGTPHMKYKVSFFLPDEADGKNLRFEFQAGTSSVDETREILSRTA